MFRDTVFLRMILVYIVASIFFTYISLDGGHYYAYYTIEEVLERDFLNYLKNFYISFLNHVNTRSDLFKLNNVDLITHFGAITIGLLILNLSFSRIKNHVWVVFFIYFVILPLPMFWFNGYLTRFDYTVYHYNSLMMFMLFSHGFAMARTRYSFIDEDIDGSYVKMSFYEQFHILMGISIIYYLTDDKFQSTLLFTSLSLFVVGYIISLVFFKVLKNKERKKIKNDNKKTTI